MADDEPRKPWDEYDWERFLQQQDRKTERYMELLEKYLDHPDRDKIIAREMDWPHLLDAEEKDWVEEMDAKFEEEMAAAADEAQPEAVGAGNAEPFEMHPLYQASFALTIWIDQLFDDPQILQNHPAAVRLATQCSIASAKLAAALSDDDTDEIGMTLAYLKRALKAITGAMDAAMQLKGQVAINPARFTTLSQRLFHIRDGIISLMGEYRAAWRQRFED
jgi:hypothetical protein